MIDNVDAGRVGRLAQDFIDEQDSLLKELDARGATIDRLVSALKTIGMHPQFIDAILAGPGAASATEEKL